MLTLHTPPPHAILTPNCQTDPPPPPPNTTMQPVNEMAWMSQWRCTFQQQCLLSITNFALHQHVYNTAYSVLSECLWKKFTGDSGGIRTHDLRLTSADVLTSRPPAILFFFNTSPRYQIESGWGNSLVPFHALRLSAIILLAYTGNQTKMTTAW